MKHKSILLVLPALFVLFFFSTGQAELYKVNLDVFTTNYTDPNEKQVNIWIKVLDNEVQRGPDSVESIILTVPGGATFNIDPVKDWLPYDEAFWKRLYPSNFAGGTIPAGTYKVAVKPYAGRTITETDWIDGKFLTPPTLINPTEGKTGVWKTPIIQWSYVPGATYYRIQLWNEDWNEPVYWYWDRQLKTSFQVIELPLGDVVPNTNYRIRIEARAGSQDMDKRSRSDWVNFRTGSW
jgi:hypothetical protein